MNFFDRLAHEQRIMSVSGLSLGEPKGGGMGNYTVHPTETVGAYCMLTTYYNKPLSAAQRTSEKEIGGRMRTMANHRFRRAGRFLTTRLWIVCRGPCGGDGIAPAWADQTPAAGRVQNTRKTVPPTTTAQPSAETAPAPKVRRPHRHGWPPSYRDESAQRDPFKLPPAPRQSRCRGIVEWRGGRAIAAGKSRPADFAIETRGRRSGEHFSKDDCRCHE